MPAPRPTETHWQIFGPLSGSPKETYSEAEVVAILSQPGDSRSVCFQLCSFPEALNLASFKSSSALVFRDCEFADEVNLTDARFDKSLSFEDCLFVQGLVLRGAHIKGLLCLEGSIIGPPKTYFDGEDIERPLHEPPPHIRSAHWDCLCVEGPFNLVRTAIFGSVDLGHAEIHGSLFMQGARIGLGEFGGRLYLRQSRIDGDLELSPWVWERTPWRLTWKGPEKGAVVGEADEIWKAHVIRWVDRVYNFHLDIPYDVNNTQKEKRLKTELDEAVCTLWKNSCPPGAPAPAQRTEIFGSLSFGASEIQGRVNIRGAHIHEALHGITAHIHNRILADCWIHPDLMRETDTGLTMDKDWFRTIIGEPEIPPSFIVKPQGKRAPARNREMRGIILEDAVIDHAVLMQGLQCVGELRMNNIRIGGTLELGVWKAKHKSGKKPYCRTTLGFPSSDAGSDCALIQMKNAQVDASVFLDGAWIDGDIDANHCKIGANLTMRASWESDWENGVRQIPEVANTKHKDRLSADAKPDNDKGWDCIDLYGAELSGNVDFSGARIFGGLKLSYLKLGGTFMLGRDTRDRTGAPRPVRAKIGFGKQGDSIRLYGAEIGGNVCIERALLKGSLMMKLAEVGGALICGPPEPTRRNNEVLSGKKW